ncbi:MAG: nucleoside 2-deoxyribosyltransferase domain-containing protein [bacterium]
MQVVYAHEPFPEAFEQSLFLAGPSPRATGHPDWRAEALACLAAQGFAGSSSPRAPRGVFPTDYDAQVAWEQAAMERSDQLIFWVPRDLVVLPGFTTNVEWGRWEKSGQVVLGHPPEAAKMRYLAWHARRWRVPVCATLAETVAAALARLGPPARRVGAECAVPLDVWRQAPFQGWYAAQRAAGNRLDGARMEWSWRVGDRRHLLVFWALQVDVHIAAEGRNKHSELLIGRPDIAAVVLYEAGAASLAETRVVLVREFRACGRTTDGCVHELPGGSSFDGGASLVEVAAEELAEELGFHLDPARLEPVGTRQLAATLSAHQGAVFRAALAPEEVDHFVQNPGPYGHAGSSEVTWPEVVTVGALLAGSDVDWANMGMILAALGPR